MGDLASARFLVGLLDDHFERARKDDERLEKYWREKHEALEQGLPSVTERTVEQWEELVRVEGELYYAMSSHSCTRAAAGHVHRLLESMPGA